MEKLNLPVSDNNIKKENDKYFIFDKWRKKYVSLTPEEWVRQNFVSFLVNHRSFPAGRIGIEIQLNLNGLKKRADSVVYDQFGKPFVLIEYKAPSVKITQSVFDQIVRYNIVMKVDYLIVSNGLEHYCCKVDYQNNSVQFLKEIPDFSLL